MSMLRNMSIALATSCLLVAPVHAQVKREAQPAKVKQQGDPRCAVEGTWEMIGFTVDGKDQQLEGWRQRKIVSKGQWMWVGEAPKRDTIAMKTLLDSLRATAFAGGAGSYSATPTTYTEKIEYFGDPTAIGRSLQADCRVEGDRWYHSWVAPFDPKDTTAKQKVVETWKKIG